MSDVYEDEEERGFVETALSAADAGNAGHWPTVAGYLADEVRRLRVAVLEASKPTVVDRAAAEQAVAEALVSHFPRRGMVVASGETCECGHWTGEEPQALLGAGMGGRDQLNRHRAIVAVAALYPKATEGKP